MLNSSAIEGMRRFLKHAETLKPKNNPRRENGFAREFQEIKELTSRLKKDPSYTTKHGEKDINRPKNRYKDILPYDYSRIILPTVQGVDGADYINGNYIKGPTDEVLYLAAQGPLPQTVNDFWRAIVSHQTQVIVMACREYELGKLKCKRYWPESADEKLTFNGIQVSLVSQEEMGDGFIIRTLCAKHKKGELQVTQFHYTAWPDHDVPRSATPLIELTMSFRAFVGHDNNVPVLIHCSAGCGRTGTICALDYALALIRLKRTENFSVFDIVSNLRKQRIAMVQTKEQYELVYKAVKEIVSNELLKQRASMHTYVNVAVGEELSDPDEQMYENVDFIRSIQRLHEEETNAARKPKQIPSSPKKAIVVAPKKELIKKDAPPNKTDSTTNQRQPQALPNQRQDQISANHRQDQISANQRQDKISANHSQETLAKAQSSPKPPLKKKPESGYENVLPLSAKKNTKPPLIPKPQNYVNVVSGPTTNEEQFNDYVNIPLSATKSVPVPEKKSEKIQKPLPVPCTVNPPVTTKRVSRELHSEKDDNIILPLPKKTEKFSDYVIAPYSSASSENIKQIPEGNLIDLTESAPTLLPLRRSSSEIEVQSDKVKLHRQRSLDSTISTDLSRSSPAIPLRDSDTTQKQPYKSITENKQPKTIQPMSSQYSLVGAVEGPRSPTDHVNGDPFENVPRGHTEKQQEFSKAKGRSSFGPIESVVSDSAPAKPETPQALPRRRSEGSSDKTSPPTSPQGKAVIGIYSVINIPEQTCDKNDELLIDIDEKQETGSSLSGLNTPNLQARPVQKAHSTENVHSQTSDLYSSLGQSKFSSTKAISKQASFESNLSDNLASVRPRRRRSEDLASLPLYEEGECTDVLGSGPLSNTAVSHMAKKRIAVRRSSSGITPSTLKPAERGDVDSLYATVGLKTKERRKTPIPADMFSPNGHSPSSSLERELRRSDNSSSSLRSINSTSSNDSFEDAPPVPTKTSDAFSCPVDAGAYEPVEKSATLRSSLDRFKSKAKTMMSSGVTVSKLSLGKKSLSQMHIASTDSLASGEALDLDTTTAKGFGRRVEKPVGARPCPSHWPEFPR